MITTFLKIISIMKLKLSSFFMIIFFTFLNNSCLVGGGGNCNYCTFETNSKDDLQTIQVTARFKRQPIHEGNVPFIAEIKVPYCPLGGCDGSYPLALYDITIDKNPSLNLVSLLNPVFEDDPPNTQTSCNEITSEDIIMLEPGQSITQETIENWDSKVVYFISPNPTTTIYLVACVSASTFNISSFTATITFSVIPDHALT